MAGPVANTRAVLVRAGGALCAVPIAEVVETMRPLPTTALAGVPEFVSGLAVVRGEPVPVVDLGRLLGSAAGGPTTRFVVVRAGARRFALAVAGVDGIADLAGADPRRLPLVAEACRSAIEAVGALDEELMVLLRAARIVPPEAWPPTPAGSAAP